MLEGTVKPTQMTLNVLLYKDGDLFVAHSLEFDIVTSAVSEYQARIDILDLVKAHITYALENDNLEHLYKPAPPEFWNMLATAKAIDLINNEKEEEPFIEADDKTYEINSYEVSCNAA